MKNLISKIITPVVLIAICVGSLSVWVYAASDYYTSTLIFQGEHEGTVRTYNHNNIAYSASVQSYIGNYKVTSDSKYLPTYKVSLYIKTWLFGSDKIGYKYLSLYGYGEAKWTNVGSGDYFFRFEKARDSVDVKSNNVVMRGY